MLRACFGTLIGILGVASVSLAEDQLRVGVNAPTSIVAEFITGNWGERGSLCPVFANRDSMKVAVFVKRLDEPVFPLVAAIEDMVADNASLKWSFVFVSHENTPTPSQDEWDGQLAQLRKLASDRKIEHLSIGVVLLNPDNGKPSKAKRTLGFFGDGDVAVMLIRPDADAKREVIQYFRVLISEEIKTKTVECIRSQIKDALAATSAKG